MEEVGRSEMNYRGLVKKLQSIAAGGGGGHGKFLGHCLIFIQPTP